LRFNGFRTFQDYPRTSTGLGDTVFDDADRQRGEHMLRGLFTRRYFVSCLGGAAALWPLAARGQQTGPARIGILTPGGELANPLFTAFRQEMHRLGYVEGRTLFLEFRSAAGRGERLLELAEEWFVCPSISF
jgi:hypothetical protein